MRGRLVVGNWKSNGNLASNQPLLHRICSEKPRLPVVDYAVCVPYPYLFQTRQALDGSAVGWGAQDLSQFGAGAYTGAVNAEMLFDFGCHYVIVGHSERRSVFGDSDEIVAAKFVAAIRAGLTPILCVGETLQEREADITETVVGRQLSTVMTKAGVAALSGAVLAYEPVWAIGTGKTAAPEHAQAVHAYIRGAVAAHDTVVAKELRVLYGGSVKAANAAQLFSMPDIDGGLIGGASLAADEFLGICRAAQRL